MIPSLARLTPPLDFRFLDLFVVLVLCLGGFLGVALLLGIGGSIVAPLEIAPRVIPDAVLSQSFQFELIGRGGHPTYHWRIAHLPDGLIGEDDGLIHGSPSAVGTFKLKATLSDQGGSTATRDLDLRVIDYANVAPLIFRTNHLPPARVSSHYEVALAVEGGVLPYTWSAFGLPVGLEIHDGSLQGIPDTAGIRTVTFRITDSAKRSVSKMLDLQVLPSMLGNQAVEPIKVLTSKMPPAVAGTPYTLQMAATGGSPPYQWQMTTNFPSTRLSPEGILEADDPGLWADGAGFTVRVFDQNSNVALANLEPSVIRPNNRILYSLCGSAAIGAWILLLAMLRRNLGSQVTRDLGKGVPIELSPQHIGFLAGGFLLAALLTILNIGWATVLFSFVAVGTATSILVRMRREAR
jgi:hypothetical protein